MNSLITYGIIFVILLVLELAYFKIADKFNIIDKPNERSSHSTIVLRGGGIIFVLSTIVWALIGFMVDGLGFMDSTGSPTEVSGGFSGAELVMEYLPFLVGLVLITGVSFVDDIHSLPDSVRLVAQFAAMLLMIYSLGMFHWSLWWLILIALVVCVGAMNIINFMDGINGITAGYSLAVLVPLALLNGGEGEMAGFIDQSFLMVAILSVVVFSVFNFRPRGKAKCFAGDVGSIGIAFIMLFALGKLVMKTHEVDTDGWYDPSWFVFLIVYGVDGCCTIIHRIMLHENLGEAHRKHAYQLMCNELKIGHVKVSLLYMAMQLVVSLGFIGMTWVMHGNDTHRYDNDDIILAHWMYLIGAFVLLAVAYVLFKKKYYHLHETYLREIEYLRQNGLVQHSAGAKSEATKDCSN